MRPRLSVPALRLTSALLPSALLLHEGVYLFAHEGAPASHNYLEQALPWLAALAASLLLASVLMPALQREPGDGGLGRSAPFQLTAALAGIFVAQEAVEILLLGGGVAALGGALGGLSVLFPLAFAVGTLGASLIERLTDVGLLIATLIRRPRSAPGSRGTERPAFPPRTDPRRRRLLAFGLSARPPPVAA